MKQTRTFTGLRAITKSAVNSDIELTRERLGEGSTMARNSETVPALQALVRKRAKPLTILLDERRRVAYADPDAVVLITRLFGIAGPLARLPQLLDLAISKALATHEYGTEIVISPTPNLCCRINWLTGPNGSFIAVYLECRRSREDLGWATNSFGLTRRERHVLHLILCGLSGPEIARSLNISEATVSDYFKHLARKTNAKNRADMVAKVLGWNVLGDPDAQRSQDDGNEHAAHLEPYAVVQ